MTNKTHKVIEGVLSEFNRQLELGIKVGEKNPEISAFIGAWDKYDDEVNDCPLTSQDRKVMRELFRTYNKKLVEVTRDERDEQWRQQLLGRILHETFRDVASKLYNRDWQGTPFEDLDDKSVRRYNAVAVEVARNIKVALTKDTLAGD